MCDFRTSNEKIRDMNRRHLQVARLLLDIGRKNLEAYAREDGETPRWVTDLLEELDADDVSVGRY